MRILLFVMLLIMAAGCGKARPAGEEPSAESRAKEVTRDVVHTMTGYDEIQAGRKAQDKIRGVSAERKKDLDEVTGN